MSVTDLRKNPVVNQPVYVHARIMEMEVVWHPCHERPELRLLMRVEPDHAEIGGHLLRAVIPSTPAAHYPRQKFTECFRLQVEDARQVEGMWIAVRLVPAEDDDERYFVVQFVSQSNMSRHRSEELERTERDDRLPFWLFEFCKI